MSLGLQKKHVSRYVHIQILPGVYPRTSSLPDGYSITPRPPGFDPPPNLMPNFSASAHLLGLNELELHASTGPHDAGGVVGVVQQRYQELPELQRATLLPVVDDDIAPAGHRAATTVPLVL